MRREFVYLSKVELYSKNELAGKSGFHFPDKDGNLVRVDKKRDGKSLQQHLDGIAYLTRLAKAGVKLFPPLVKRLDDGRFRKLDGFKRLYAMRQAGLVLAECFVCEKEDMGKSFNYDGIRMAARDGGQGYGRFPSPVEYGEDPSEQRKGGKIINLYVGKSLKVEYRENIHIHFGPAGRFRFALGRRDFDLLVELFNGNSSSKG